MKEDYAELRARLAPYAAAQDGITRRVKELSEARDDLAADLDAMQQTPQGSLAERVQTFAADKKKLEDGVANLEMQFSKLATLREDVERLCAKFDRALDAIAVSGDGAADADARLEELPNSSRRRKRASIRYEARWRDFGQLRAKLGDLQSRLASARIHGRRRHGSHCASEGYSRPARRQDRPHRRRRERRSRRAREDFLETKKELEKRVSSLTEKFSKLATIRKDIAGLFDKLSNAADTSSN